MSNIRVTLWRDYTEAAWEIPEMFLGDAEAEEGAPAASALRFSEQGARRVDLADDVDIRRGADHGLALEQLSLIRELTRIGLWAHWTLRCEDDFPVSLFQHLYPPSAVVQGDVLHGDGVQGDGDAARRWRMAYRFGSLSYRKGPGFIQISDSRTTGKRRLTFSRQTDLDAVRVLDRGAPLDSVPPAVASAFRAHRLVADIGPYLWWLPYRVRRWPDPRG
ncbi:hypothetical protein Acsp03_70220 [Actinomadura sp. NBRC 104412]|uniref:DUF5825 family protein n=1 Tax=Actinomadura sp. NBRC 104412 TaxID=3032203 RepID=UPI0024A295DA|nr:DUF5825 family protein [Actinomadura sp. NBRC 104412]GLZ09556.1 hypothetical protein Acsp03_70220 [Actinomadura sp. NBRC 104412]